MPVHSAKHEKGSSRSVIRQLAQLVLSALAGYLLAVSALRLLPDYDLSLWGIVALLLGLWLVLAVHEFEHLLGGHLIGFRAQLFACGPALLIRERGSFRLRWNRHLTLWGGVAVSTPSDTQNLRQRMLAVIVGGPLASTLFGLLCVMSGLGLHGTLLLLGLMSFAIALVTLWPGITSGFHTDGAQILRLLQGGPEANRQVAHLSLVGFSYGGIRPRDWNQALVTQAVGEADGSLSSTTGHYFAYLRFLDLKRIEPARHHLRETLADLEALPSVSRPAVLLEAAYFMAAHDRNPERARELRAEAKGGLMVPPYQRPLADAAISYAEGDHLEALRYLEGAESALRSGIDKGHATMAKELIDELRRGIRPRR